MAEGGNSKDVILKEWLSTGINSKYTGSEWTSVTHLVVYIKDNDGTGIYAKYFRNNKDNHAEINMIKHSEFEKMVRKGKVDITVTSNYSPCSDCASSLITFYGKYKECINSFTIRFAFLYFINKTKNRDGLKNLKEAGIILEAMTEKSWFEVFMLFKFSSTLADQVRKKDEDTRAALSELLNEVPETGQVADAGEEPGIEELTQKTKTLEVTAKNT